MSIVNTMNTSEDHCPACNGSVSGWCPESSQDNDDHVCYGCGLHVNSEAWKRITELSEALEEAILTISDDPTLDKAASSLQAVLDNHRHQPKSTTTH